MRNRGPELKWGAGGQKCMGQLSTEGTAPLQHTPGVGRSLGPRPEHGAGQVLGDEGRFS